jgi:protein-disulfide isomerase
MSKLLAVLAALFLPLVCAQKAAPAKPALDKAAIEQFARYLYLWPAEISVSVSDPRPSGLSNLLAITVTASARGITEPHNFHISPDGKRIFEAPVYTIESPFADQLSKLKTDLSPSQGTPGAPVVMVLFSDFQCPYCGELQKTLSANLLKSYPSQVRIYFKDFPLDALHPWARPASIAGRCVFRQEPAAFWDYHDWIFGKQASIKPDTLRNEIITWAQGKGLDTMQLGRCMDTKATEKEVEKTIAEGRELQLQSTPTLFVNGRPLPGATPWPTLKAVIDFEIERQKRTGEGGEKCCELRLSPLPAKPTEKK